MTNGDLILNIAVNLGRLGRYALKNNPDRIKQFLNDSDNYLRQIKVDKLSAKYTPTHRHFLTVYQKLKNKDVVDVDWADTAFTWANILTHRAKLA